MPLCVVITDRAGRPLAAFELQENRRLFTPCERESIALRKPPCRKLRPSLVTCDLRLP